MLPRVRNPRNLTGEGIPGLRMACCVAELRAHVLSTDWKCWPQSTGRRRQLAMDEADRRRWRRQLHVGSRVLLESRTQLAFVFNKMARGSAAMEERPRDLVDPLGLLLGMDQSGRGVRQAPRCDHNSAAACEGKNLFVGCKRAACPRREESARDRECPHCRWHQHR